MGVTWIRVDVSFLRNPKLIILRRTNKHRAIVLHLAALLYAGEHGTDGFISRDVADELGAKPADVNALTEVMLWRAEADAGWSINGWADKQATSAENGERSNRMRALALKRWHPEEAHA